MRIFFYYKPAVPRPSRPTLSPTSPYSVPLPCVVRGMAPTHALRTLQVRPARRCHPCLQDCRRSKSIPWIVPSVHGTCGANPTAFPLHFHFHRRPPRHFHGNPRHFKGMCTGNSVNPTEWISFHPPKDTPRNHHPQGQMLQCPGGGSGIGPADYPPPAGRICSEEGGMRRSIRPRRRAGSRARVRVAACGCWIQAEFNVQDFSALIRATPCNSVQPRAALSCSVRETRICHTSAAWADAHQP
eukprot:gene25360-biopygen16492